MKKLTEKEKVQRYDIAVELAAKFKKEYLNYKELNVHKGVIEAFNSIFPELNSEDERMRNFISNELACLRATDEKGTVRYEELTNAIAWLEKQGGNLVENGYTNNKDFIKYADNYSHEIWHKLMDNFKNIKDYHIGCNDVSDIVLNAIIDTCNWLEKQGEQETLCDKCRKEHPSHSCQDITELGRCTLEYEQKPADKVEPKFKVGDWVVTSYGKVNQVIAVDEDGDGFTLDDETYFNGSWKDGYHLWTIADAKDGDVLVSNDDDAYYIVLFKGLSYLEDNIGRFKSYCHYCEGILSPREDPSWCCNAFHPATKEQRDTLMKAMADAGYTFDFEKKELKKIDQKSKDYTFKAIPRLLEMIQPTDRAKSYCQKLIDSLEQEGYGTDAKIVRDCLKQMNGEKVAMATMDEQKSTDKVEPKVGDWLVHNERRNIIKVVNATPLVYECVDILGYHNKMLNTAIENNYHLWTIQDAREGDVLAFSYASKNYIIIYRGLHEKSFDTIMSVFCFYNVEEDKYYDEIYFFHAMNTGEVIKPATKEQRDVLMKAMTDAGYIFDFDKKELKKIEQSKLTEFEDAIKDMMNDYRDAIDDNDATIEEVKKHAAYLLSLIPQNPTGWSEEDENRINRLIAYFEDKESFTAEDDIAYANWLKSLKDRVSPQNFAVTDEELAQAKKDAYNDALDKIEYHSGEPTFDDGWSAAIDYIQKKSLRPQPKNEWSEEDERIYRGIHNLIYSTPYCDSRNELSDWLKSLKERVQPKQEWSEEDERCLTNAIDACNQMSDEDYVYSQGYIDAIKWLKSLKDRYTLKPTE